MTKEREPLTYERALCKIAALIGWDQVGAVIGVGARAARMYGEPDLERELSLIDCERLDRAFIDRGGDHAPFQRTLTLRLGLSDSDGILCGDAFASAAEKVAKEAGEATAALIRVAAKPDCRATRRTARKEARDLIEALGTAEAALGKGD